MADIDFLTACGLTEQFGIRYTHGLFGQLDDWYAVDRKAECLAAFAEDAADGAVLIHRWIGETWVHRG